MPENEKSVRPLTKVGLDGRCDFKLSADLEEGRVPDPRPLLEN